MAHRPQPIPTGSEFKDKRARKQYNNEHRQQAKRQSKYNQKNAQTTYDEIKSGKYTTGGRHLFGMKPVAGGYFTAEDPTTEDLPSQEVEGKFGEIKKAASNIRWILENKSVSDQEEKMLESLLLGVESHIELEIDRDQTFHNQADAKKMDAGEFFSTGTKGVPSDLPGDQALFPESITSSSTTGEDKKIADNNVTNSSPVVGGEESKEQTPMMTIADLEAWEKRTRDTTPAGKAFGESGAKQRMDIRKNYLKSRGTIFDDNVRD